MDEQSQTLDELPPRRKAARSQVPLVAGASVGAALIVILVVWGLTRQPSAPAPAPAPAAAAPSPPAAAPPVPTATAAPAAVEPPPPLPEPRAEAAPPPDAAEEARGERRLPRKVASAPPAPREARPASSKGIRSVREELNSIATPSAQSGDGVLSVIATPWAEVYVDGSKIGETPREIRLGAGTYRLRATNPNLGTRETTIVIQAGKRKVWNATFAN
jgi:hypothetical protein